jgi:hypothetical protein
MPENRIIVIKRDHQSREVWQYEGRILLKNSLGFLIEAFFNREDLPFHGIVIKHNDRFKELYLRGRWFNIFAVHDRDDDHLKAWYCNVTRPAIIQKSRILYDDLALDLLVYPNGKKLVLDEDEFIRLNLNEKDANSARTGLKELKKLFINPGQFSFENLLEEE